MRNLLLTSTLAFTASIGLQAYSGQPTNFSKSQGITLEENRGQVRDQHNYPRPDVLFTSTAKGKVMHLREDGISYQFFEKTGSRVLFEGHGPDPNEDLVVNDHLITRIDVDWLDASMPARITTASTASDRNNYYNIKTGGSPALDVPRHGAVTLHELWPDVDLLVHGSEGAMEIDWHLLRASSVGNIRFRVRGATVDSDGRYLHLRSPAGTITEGPLQVLQHGRPVEASWLIEDDVVSISVQGADPAAPLLIDPPVLDWATYFGGAGNVQARNVLTDAQGNIYQNGWMEDIANIATTGVHQELFGGGDTDTFLVKFDAEGNRLWATFFGGIGMEEAWYGAMDASGAIYFAGQTNSPNNIATPGTHQTVLGGQDDVLIAKFDQNGALLWATYLGGSADDSGFNCETDPDGNVYVSGYTRSDSAMATVGAHQTTLNSVQDAFLAKFTPLGQLIWCTYYGGDETDHMHGVSYHPSGHVFVSGWTGSSDSIATPGSHQPSFGGGINDGFLAKFDLDGNRLWGTYYGGSAHDIGRPCIVSQDGSIYMQGYTESDNNISTPGSYQSSRGGGNDLFLARFDTDGNRLWGTYYGGPADDLARVITLDNFHRPMLCGSSMSTTSIATLGAVQSNNAGGDDMVVARFTPAGQLDWGTYYGGSGDDRGLGIAVDVFGNLLISGTTTSTGIATPGSFQEVHGDGGLTDDGLLVKLACPAPTLNLTSDQNAVCLGDTVNLSATPTPPGGDLLWNPGGASGSTQSYAPDVDLDVIVTYTDLEGCVVSASESITVLPLPPTPSITQNGTTLTCDPPGSEHVWTLNGTVLPGEDGAALEITTGGSYQVVVTDANGCSAISEPFQAIITSIEEDADHRGFTIFPNPGDGHFNVLISGPGDRFQTLRVLDMMGRTVHVQRLPVTPSGEPFVLDLAQAALSTYLLVLEGDGKRIQQRIVVQ
ncbi:MAG: hypothetical protein IPM12_00075 [Flavobacteriales bacterium]|nr:hypothetical protein [Flavobacteriales bacterium]